ncbi:ZZ-type zinc finger-containing protein 3 isoform X1 [Oncorhynchus mykiss]|uniref:ZZ-type zinc finger-containing protein 3 isoform X1 n=2 Tax=Oncorhynchus TaxID=8016 RepID=UPI001877B2A0|nr:ZZ-type zinc finger-containing protein 3 isoform X1 [Oncorhynchus mykiss]XP_036821912.1 ZZ-type zinc finger-containing protein 3 isoform X1 [Oncorhynchus mykiss]XP_036821913.1 ZZ-type zinc finger-containing protein 3 isoform X1 [Oncorhynchus mykiss]
MAASRSSRVTRSSVGLNGLDENFCGRTLRNRSIAQPEECQGSPLPGSRAPRSPKKRQDDQDGASEKPGGHQGKVAHHKATSVDGETWASPRKRVLSCSEREGVGGSEKAENCEGRGKETSGAVGRDASPLLKRAKRCFRSGESHGSKDDLPSAPPMPVIPASPCAPLTTVKENSEGGDLLRQNSTAASPSSSSPDLNKEEGEEEEDDGHVQQLLNSNSHKSCIGLGQTSSSPDAQTNSLCLSAASNTTCPGPGPALLNGSQRGAPCPSPPDPVVPCRNYDPGQEEGKDYDPGQEEGGKDSDPGQEEGGKDSDPGQEEECKDSDPGQEEGGKDSDPGQEEVKDSDPGQEEGGKDSDPGQEEGGKDSDPGQEEGGKDSDPGQEEGGKDSDPGQEEVKDSDPGQEEGGKDSDPGQEEGGKDSDPGMEEEGEDSDPGMEEGEDSDPGQEEGAKDSDPGQEEGGKDSDPGQEEGGKDSDPGQEEVKDSDPGQEEGGKDSDPGQEEVKDSDPGQEEEGKDSDPGQEEVKDSDPGMEEESEDSDPGQEEVKDSDPGMEEEGKDSGECPAPLLASFEEDSSTPHLSVREEEVEVTPTEEEESCGGGINGWSFMPLVVQNTVATSIIINNNIINNNINNVNNNNNNSGEFTMPLLAPPTRSDPPCTPSISSTSPPSFTEPHEHRYTLRTSPRRAACGGGKAVAPCSSPRDPLRDGVEAGRELVATPTLSSCSSIQAREGSLLSPPSVPMEQGNGGARRDRVGWDSTGHGELCETRGGLEEVPGGGSQQEDDPDVYYFESDHLTLKHNKDYQRLLQTVGVLEAQRTQSIRDLERLARQQREALRDPVSFVEQLQKQVELDLPRPQRMVQLPDVAWDQYTSGLGDFEREFCDKKRTTRRLKLIFDKVRLPDGPKSPLDPKKEEGEPSTLYSALPSSDALENSNNSQRIRGRLCYQSKPDTFNQLWTAEEQKKLEHLLLQFSPEEVESKRWQKIADALGNRTAKQVASRVQKYFIKLTKAGISVPGRTPNMCIYSKKVSNKRQHHLNKHLYRPSTFLTSYEPPVFMEEEDERAAYYSSLQDPDGDDTDEEGVPVELRHLPEYKELLELKRMKKHKLQEIQAESSMALHHGYKCDVCGVEPIQGVRWHCQDCPSDNAVDFCSNCSDCLYKTESHLPSHHLEPVHHHETFLDRDYCLAQTPGYNYLDPNYYPANR